MAEPGSVGPRDQGPGPSGTDEARRRQSFEDGLARKASRKLRARAEGDRGIWFGLGMMGVVGWSVAVPTVLGIAVGVWLDARATGGGRISWTLTGLVVGVFIGCLNAWFWIARELEDGP